jgi:ubiquinone/menaquinone biosynthesis C-methylase UbiE
MIDPEKVRQFWEGRAAVLGKVAFESVGNLEQDEANLKLKIDDETRKVFEWLPDVRDRSVLDLGAGVGQWAFRFAERGARRVLAVEYAQGLVDIGRAEGKRRGLGQVEFRVSSAEQFQTRETFDLVYISGLFVYLNDEQAAQLLSRLNRFARPGGLLMVRDGTGVLGRHEIDDRFSEHLGEQYSATYRTRDEYVSAIGQRGFELLRDENVFPEGHPLNKYPETRLHLFLFGKTN